MKKLIATILLIAFPSWAIAADKLAFPLRDFSGGLNTTSSPQAVEQNQTPDCQNVHTTTSGAIVKRNGYSQLNTVAITGMTNFEDFENEIEPSATSQETYTTGTDDASYLVGNSGETLDISHTTSTVYENSLIGDFSDTEYESAQRFATVGAISVNSVEFGLAGNDGSPTGDITLKLETDSANLPSGTQVTNASGTVTPTPSAYNKVTFDPVVSLSAATNYWITLAAVNQATNVRFKGMDDANGYASHGRSRRVRAGAWDAMGTDDLNFKVNRTNDTSYDLAQSFQLSAARRIKTCVFTVGVIKNSYSDTVTVTIQTDSSGAPSGTVVTNGTGTVAISSTGSKTVTFTAPYPVLSASTTYWIVWDTPAQTGGKRFSLRGRTSGESNYASGSSFRRDGAGAWSSNLYDINFTLNGYVDDNYWFGINADSTSIASDTTNEKEGSTCITFNKSGSASTSGGIRRTIASTNISTANRVKFWVYLSALTDVASVKLRLSSTLSTVYRTWTIADTSLAAGWNFIDVTYASGTNTGSFDNTAVIDEQLEVVFDAAGNTLTDIRFDHLHYANSTGEPIDGLMQYLPVSGTEYFIVAADDIFKMESLDGTWDWINPNNAITGGNLVDMAQYGDKVLIVNGVDAPLKWDGSANEVSTMGLPTNVTIPKYVCTFQDRVFIGNVTLSGTKKRDRVYWTDTGTPDTYTATNFQNLNENDDTGAITGLEPLGDNLIIYKDNSVWSLVPTGQSGASAFAKVLITNEVGAVAGHAIETVQNKHIFWAKDGIYINDGSEVLKLSGRIDETIRTYSNSIYDKVVSAVYPTLNQVWFGCASTGSTNQRVIVYDYGTNSFWLHTGINTSYVANYRSSNKWFLYTGDYSGYVYRQDSTTADAPLGVSTAIDAYYYTPWLDFGAPGYTKRLQHILTFTDAPGNWNVLVGWSLNYNSGVVVTEAINLNSAGFVLGTSLLSVDVFGIGGDLIDRVDALAHQGQVIRFKVSNANASESFKVYQLIPIYTVEQIARID